MLICNWSGRNVYRMSEGEADGGTSGSGPVDGPAGTAESVDAGISEMLADFGFPPEGGEEEGEKGEKPAEKASTEGEKKAEEPSGEGEKEDEPPSDERDALIENLRKQVLELTGQLKSGEKKAEETSEKGEKGEQSKAEETKFAGSYFKSDDEYNKSFEDPTVMNEVLARVRADTIQGTLAIIPQILAPVIEGQVAIQVATREFYSANKDLIPSREFVGHVANDLSGKNPDWTLERLFTELGKEVRTRLGLKETAESKDKQSERGKRPAFVQKGTGPRTPAEKQPELSSLEQEIADLM